jgi:hypothetical protein
VEQTVRVEGRDKAAADAEIRTRDEEKEQRGREDSWSKEK